MSKRKLKIGDHLVVNRLLYTHHGIYVGSGKVIHYNGSPGNIHNAIVEETTLENFKKVKVLNNDFDCEIYIKSEKDSKFKSKEIVQRANSRLGERNYNLFFNNCESFCNWCINGASESNQVKAILNYKFKFK